MNERETTLMTRTSKYLNQDTITALQSFQIEKIDREINDYLDTDHGQLIFTKTNSNGMNLSWIH